MVRSSDRFGGSVFPEAVTAEFEAIGIVDKPVQDGVGQGRIADDLVPTLDRHLAGDHDGAGVVAILDDLQQVAALLGVQWFRTLVAEHQ